MCLHLYADSEVDDDEGPLFDDTMSRNYEAETLFSDPKLIAAVQSKHYPIELVLSNIGGFIPNLISLLKGNWKNLTALQIQLNCLEESEEFFKMFSEVVVELDYLRDFNVSGSVKLSEERFLELIGAIANNHSLLRVAMPSQEFSPEIVDQVLDLLNDNGTLVELKFNNSGNVIDLRSLVNRISSEIFQFRFSITHKTYIFHRASFSSCSCCQKSNTIYIKPTLHKYRFTLS